MQNFMEEVSMTKQMQPSLISPSVVQSTGCSAVKHNTMGLSWDNFSGGIKTWLCLLIQSMSQNLVVARGTSLFLNCISLQFGADSIIECGCFSGGWLSPLAQVKEALNPLAYQNILGMSPSCPNMTVRQCIQQGPLKPGSVGLVWKNLIGLLRVLTSTWGQAFWSNISVSLLKSALRKFAE